MDPGLETPTLQVGHRSTAGRSVRIAKSVLSLANSLGLAVETLRSVDGKPRAYSGMDSQTVAWFRESDEGKNSVTKEAPWRGARPMD